MSLQELSTLEELYPSLDSITSATPLGGRRVAVCHSPLVVASRSARPSPIIYAANAAAGQTAHGRAERSPAIRSGRGRCGPTRSRSLGAWGQVSRGIVHGPGPTPSPTFRSLSGYYCTMLATLLGLLRQEPYSAQCGIGIGGVCDGGAAVTVARREIAPGTPPGVTHADSPGGLTTPSSCTRPSSKSTAALTCI